MGKETSMIFADPEEDFPKNGSDPSLVSVYLQSVNVINIKG